MTSIYVGNLERSATEEDLREIFTQHGTVSEVNIVTDRDTGASRGFAFVEMPDGAEAAVAIKEAHLAQINGRSITCDEARPRTPTRGGGRGRRR